MSNLISHDIFGTENMKSGHICLNLNNEITWDDFPEYAERLLSLVEGEIQEKTDAFDIRIWEVKIKTELFRLVFDDFPMMISLESLSDQGDKIIRKIQINLSKKP